MHPNIHGRNILCSIINHAVLQNILCSIINYAVLQIILRGIISHSALYITLSSLHTGYRKTAEVDSNNLTISAGLHLQNALRGPVIEGTYDVGFSIAEMIGNL